MKIFLKNGYTLVEMAVVITVAGILLGSGALAYQLYLKNQRIDITKETIANAQNALGGFRSLYGRYPCPADPTAVRGDVNYGYEERTGSACDPTNLQTAMSANAALTDKVIYMGSLPFRELNLQEDATHDGYNNRLYYAVMNSQTDSATYTDGNGGISLVDATGASVVTPPDSLDFILISAGPDGVGAYTRDGVLHSVCTGSALEVENCDADEIFIATEEQVGFDDSVAYSTNIPQQQWQFSSNLSDIQLRRANSVVMGATQNENLAGSPALEVRDITSDTGTILIESGAMMSSQLCDATGGVNCFAPNLIAGDLTTGTGGMDCSPGYLVGIRNGAPVCRDKIEFTCPPGEFMAGFNASGNLICATNPDPGCLATTVTTTCGTTQSLAATYSGNSLTAYSGTSYTLPNLTAADTTAINAQPNLAGVQAYINTLNSNARGTLVGGPTSTDALVRDTYTCNAGVWTGSVVQHARGNTAASWPSNVLAATTAYNNPAQSFNAGTPMSTDPSNSNGGTLRHHCWCREDYRVQSVACGTAMTGTGFRVQKHRCPQTNHGWSTVLTNSSAFCTCNAGPVSSTQTCAAYYARSTSQISGNITTTTPYTCDASGNPVPGASTVSHNCVCKAQSPNPVITTTDCPVGTGNSFTYGGNTYNNKAEVYENTWSCGSSGPGPAPVNSAADLGSWSGNVLKHTEPCGCVPLADKTVVEPCPAGSEGPGIFYNVEWDCGTGTWETKPGWDLIDTQCSACHWKAPSGTPSLVTYKPANVKDELCPTKCGTGGSCGVDAGGGNYNIYSCQCGG